MNPYSRINLRKSAQKKLTEVLAKPHRVFIIHYSCESFYDLPKGRSARITSIAIRFFESGQNLSFSIHRIAELKGIKFEDIEQHYDDLEKRLLEDFYEFVEKHSDYFWIHWNMRDVNFGFEALSHRCQVLGGKIRQISNHQKIDLAKHMLDKYGKKYIEHPRFEKLADKNGFTKSDFLTGEKEAQAFKDKKFVELHKSTLRKVEIVNNILIYSMDNSLKHNASYKSMYGLTASGLKELYKENLWFALIVWLLGVLCGYVLQNVF